MSMGATTVPVYATSSGEQIGYILNHSEAKVFIMEDISYYDRIEKRIADIPSLEKIIVVTGGVPTGNIMLMALKPFLSVGERIALQEVRQIRSTVTSDMVATFIYTSGTTGHPKAVMLTQKNCCSAGENVYLSTKTTFENIENKFSCSFLPLSHVADRAVNLFASLYIGTSVYFIRNFGAFLEDIKDIRPTIWIGVPRVWEKIYEGVMEHCASMSETKGKIIGWALKTGLEYNTKKYEKQTIPVSLKASHSVAKILVINKLLRRLGLDRVKYTITGGAPTSKEILDFFFSMGVWLMNVYGQTESHGIATIETADQMKFGSVGKPYPKVDVKIADDGEIMIRSDTVSAGYYKDPALTSETFRDGWLYTGDLGRIEDDGFLHITGRTKDIIITSGGKNITPAKIEGSLMSSPLIEHAVVVGEGKKYLTALLTINMSYLQHVAGNMGGDNLKPDDLIKSKAIQDEVAEHVAAINQKFSRVEQIKKYKILPNAFTPETGEMTHLLKIKRYYVMKKYVNEIDELYQSAPNSQ